MTWLKVKDPAAEISNRAISNKLDRIIQLLERRPVSKTHEELAAEIAEQMDRQTIKPLSGPSSE